MICKVYQIYQSGNLQLYVHIYNLNDLHIHMEVNILSLLYGSHYMLAYHPLLSHSKI